MPPTSDIEPQDPVSAVTVIDLTASPEVNRADVGDRSPNFVAGVAVLVLAIGVAIWLLGTSGGDEAEPTAASPATEPALAPDEPTQPVPAGDLRLDDVTPNSTAATEVPGPEPLENQPLLGRVLIDEVELNGERWVLSRFDYGMARQIEEQTHRPAGGEVLRLDPDGRILESFATDHVLPDALAAANGELFVTTWRRRSPGAAVAAMRINPANGTVQRILAPAPDASTATDYRELHAAYPAWRLLDPTHAIELTGVVFAGGDTFDPQRLGELDAWSSTPAPVFPPVATLPRCEAPKDLQGEAIRVCLSSEDEAVAYRFSFGEVLNWSDQGDGTGYVIDCRSDICPDLRVPSGVLPYPANSFIAAVVPDPDLATVAVLELSTTDRQLTWRGVTVAVIDVADGRTRQQVPLDSLPGLERAQPFGIDYDGRLVLLSFAELPPLFIDVDSSTGEAQVYEVGGDLTAGHLVFAEEATP